MKGKYINTTIMLAVLAGKRSRRLGLIKELLPESNTQTVQNSPNQNNTKTTPKKEAMAAF